MPANRSNKDLIADILKLDPDAAVADLKNPALQDLLASLKGVALIGPAAAQLSQEDEAEAKALQEKAADEEKAAAEKAAAEKAAAEKAAAEKAAAEKAAAETKPVYVIARGKAVMCPAGILAEGDSVETAHFELGDESLQTLIASGHVVKL